MKNILKENKENLKCYKLCKEKQSKTEKSGGSSVRRPRLVEVPQQPHIEAVIANRN